MQYEIEINENGITAFIPVIPNPSGLNIIATEPFHFSRCEEVIFGDKFISLYWGEMSLLEIKDDIHKEVSTN